MSRRHTFVLLSDSIAVYPTKRNTYLRFNVGIRDSVHQTIRILSLYEWDILMAVTPEFRFGHKHPVVYPL